MNFPAIAQIDAYWEGLREGRLMPSRSEIDPRGIESALSFAMMLEHLAPGVARLRVAGMHLNDLLGMEVRGMPLTAFFEPAARVRVAEALDRVVGIAGGGPQVADLRLKSPAGLGRPPLSARLYLAPLSVEHGGHPRMLGCLQSLGPMGRAPRRFDVEDVQMRRLVAAAPPGMMAPLPNVAPNSAQFEMAEPPAPFAHAPQMGPAKGRPYLRLVKSDG